jgi:4-phospho-D-threonate 3-dehydrogenase / 4-phospho-D-erythronate 3-dehydrogenase
MSAVERNLNYSSDRPRVAITMGDPSGVGPEICVRLLQNPAVNSKCVPIVYGDASVLARAAECLGLPFKIEVISAGNRHDTIAFKSMPAVVDFNLIQPAKLEIGKVSAACGRASLAYLEAAITDALSGKVDAVTTAPIHKEAIHAAGSKHIGHTEILAEATNAKQYLMMLTAPTITCSLVTAHVGLAQAPSLLTSEKILLAMELTIEAMERLREITPRLTVCGLNPHAGEGGLLGQGEEERLIVPAIEIMRSRGYSVVGPLPPDTAFLPARRAQTDAYICMYHDQGLIPLKMLAFDSAINITLGLPIIRTSVDHGTAFDIAWKGVASANSLIEAVQIAAQLALRAKFKNDSTP